MAAGRATRVRRFERATRALHWLNAATFLLLLISGLLIYLPEVKAREAGGYRLVPLLHIMIGVAFLIGPALILLLARGRRSAVTDIGGALTPARGDAVWLNWAMLSLLGARGRAPRVAKFNAGQKLNSWYWLLAWFALSATGVVLGINFFTKRVFGAEFVESVFPYHEIIALFSILPLLGHLYVALINRSTRPALSSMFDGSVDAAWAGEHHPAWSPETRRS